MSADRLLPSPRSQPGAGWSAGAVTGFGRAPTVVPAEPVAAPPMDPAKRQRRHLMWFTGAATAILAAGAVVMVVLAMNGGGPFRADAAAPTDLRPALARLCPPSTASPAVPDPNAGSTGPTRPAVPAGDRTVDAETGISYRAYGAPWQPWTTVWRAGTLNVPYKVGQHFVTETYSAGSYHASILSAAVPAADNDALTLDLECVGRQVAADVRAEYYPQPTRMDPVRDERTTLGGRPAWVTVFRLHFTSPGLRATDELAAVACIDVGRTTAAVLYVSIPGTHRQLDWVVEDVLASVRTA